MIELDAIKPSLSTPQCVVPGCAKTARKQRRSGLCTMHQARMDRHGSLADPTPSIAQRIADRIEVTPSGCWQWTGKLTGGGYSRMRVNGRPQSGHRVSYINFRGPIPEGLVLDHLCRNRACVNPDHLEPVTMRENTMRSPIAPTAINAAKTHCDNGHEFTPENTRTGRNRQCRACGRDYQRAYVARRAAS